MTKEDKLTLADNLRKEIYKLRTKGYTYKIFYSVINYKPTDFYNFMRGYGMSDDNLLLLKDYLTKNHGSEL